MLIFVTYAREDRVAVQRLAADIERAHHEVWLDNELTGGQDWWDTILRRIAATDLYLFVVSPSSLASRACAAELGYARALARPLLPVQIADVDAATVWPELANIQPLNFRTRTVESVIPLVRALAAQPPAPRLPDRMPPPPPAPISYMSHLHDQLAAAYLPPEQQLALVSELGAYLGRGDSEETAAVELLRRLSTRTDLLAGTRHQITWLLEPFGPAPGPAQGVRHPNTFLIPILATTGILLFGVTAVMAIIMATRAIQQTVAQPGRFNNRRTLLALRWYAVGCCGLGLLYVISNIAKAVGS